MPSKQLKRIEKYSSAEEILLITFIKWPDTWFGGPNWDLWPVLFPGRRLTLRNRLSIAAPPTVACGKYLELRQL